MELAETKTRKEETLKYPRIAVIGSGYVGLTTGACMAKLGHEVVCVDIDAVKVEQLSRGEVSILEEGLTELVQAGLAVRKLRFVVGAAAAVKNCAVVFMCVPTPQGADGEADLSLLMAVIEEVKDHLASGAVVVNKSTVPVGTAEVVLAAIGRDDVAVASNPEFLREGSAVKDFLEPDRIVIGATSPAAAKMVAELYDRIDAPKLLVDTRTAELIKYASNAFLAAKISFANSVSNLSEALGADAEEVLRGMGYDNRIGDRFLRPGPGWGGSCFPKDTYALIHMAESAGYNFDLLKAVIKANDVQTELMIDKIRDLVGGRLAGARVAAWGLSFKAGTDDTRQSPALRIIERLVSEGATVSSYDPGVKVAPPGITLSASALDACDQADALVVLTEWPEFREVPASAVAQRLAHKRLLDTRRIVDAGQYVDAGFEVMVVGRGRKVG